MTRLRLRMLGTGNALSATPGPKGRSAPKVRANLGLPLSAFVGLSLGGLESDGLIIGIQKKPRVTAGASLSFTATALRHYRRSIRAMVVRVAGGSADFGFGNYVKPHGILCGHQAHRRVRTSRQ